jgi:hypothetical protein
MHSCPPREIAAEVAGESLDGAQDRISVDDPVARCRGKST